jgi:hypothetical protein
MIRLVIDSGEAMDSIDKHSIPMPKTVSSSLDGFTIRGIKGQVVQEHIFNCVVAEFLFRAASRCGIACIRNGYTNMDGYKDVIGGITPSQDVRNRQQVIKKLKADIVVSIHHNYSSRKAAKGFEVWYRSDTTKQGNSISLAENISSSMGTLDIPNRGIKSDNVKGMTNCKAMNCKAAVIVECDFMSNEESLTERLLNLKYQKQVAEYICMGICHFLDIPYITEAPVVNTNVQFKIQTGAFADLNNAKAEAKKIQELGFAAEITGSKVDRLYRVSIPHCGSTIQEAKDIQQALRLKGVKFSMIKGGTV